MRTSKSKEKDGINVLREKKEFQSFLKKYLTNDQKYDIINKLLKPRGQDNLRYSKKVFKNFEKKYLTN